eukprot:gene1864-3615_t
MRSLRYCNQCPPVAWIEPFRSRADLAHILYNLNFTVGVELGVQRGIFSAEIIRHWLIAREYVLVDLWEEQSNYKDLANVKTIHQESHMRHAIKLMNDLKKQYLLNNFIICRNYTTICVKQFSDDYFDFIYVDARHDYKGVLQDITDWWPKLKAGGIMAGHDYTEQKEPNTGPEIPADPHNTNQNWTLNYDGSIDDTGRVVRGAVNDFFSDKTGALAGCPRQVTVSYRERGWNTWAARK